MKNHISAHALLTHFGYTEPPVPKFTKLNVELSDHLYMLSEVMNNIAINMHAPVAIDGVAVNVADALDARGIAEFSAIFMAALPSLDTEEGITLIAELPVLAHVQYWAWALLVGRCMGSFDSDATPMLHSHILDIMHEHFHSCAIELAAKLNLPIWRYPRPIETLYFKPSNS